MNGAAFLIAVAIVVGLSIPLSLWFALAAAQLWSWFVVPTFNLPPLSVLQMWGVCLTLTMMRPKVWSYKQEKDWESSIMAIILGPLISLGLGYAIKFWWM